MKTIVECVPNFSEGRDAAKVEAIVKAMLDGPEVYLLDKEMDAEHNRSVITIVGTKESVGEAALRGIGKAAELIDLNQHQGAHPRIGATDVVPFVPVEGATLEDCVQIAEWVAEQVWRRFHIPTYLYEAAARTPERKNLENIRRGQFEGLAEEVRTNPARRPDFGEAALHRTAGATVVGARKFLIAYNINLDTADVGLAKAIARKIRASSGGFPSVKAMGVELKARGQAQVSLNLTDYETTSIATVFDAVAHEAAAHGVKVAGSEFVGLVPRRALESSAVQYLKVENFHPELVFETRLARAIAESRTVWCGAAQASGAGLRPLAEPFVEALAAETPTPGGGSAAALAGALAAALGEMVCRLTLRRPTTPPETSKALQEHLARLATLRARLLENIDRDARSYEAVLAAMKLSKASEEDQNRRRQAIGEASKAAASVPLETAGLALEAGRILEALRAITLKPAASDLAVADHLAHAALRGAIENVRANLPAIDDRAWLEAIEGKLRALAPENDGPQKT